MSQLPYRANLASGHFPFYSAYQGQTVILGKTDQAFTNQVVVGQDSEDKDKGIPQIYYCHNVMPTKQGVQSIGFVNFTPSIVGETRFDDFFVIRDEDENKYLYSPAGGQNFVFNGVDNAWASANATPTPSDAFVSVAYINGKTYICIPNNAIYEYDSAATVFNLFPVTGIVTADILGICASNGFLIAWDSFSIYRSTATDASDFTPDPSLGSGASIPQDIGGTIVSCLPIAGGFIIYTTKNAVAATFSQNIRFPFIYAEIQGSAGILTPRHVAWQNNIGAHYAWTEAGLQKVDKSKAVIILPEVTDFLTSHIFEDYDTTNNTFTVQKLAAQVQIKLAIVGRRYLVLSYGPTFPFPCALIYDTALKRWGKVKITHACAFELYAPGANVGPTWTELAPLTWDDLGITSWASLADQVRTWERANETIAFLGIDGAVNVVNMDEVHTEDNAVAIFGKYQFVRERFVAIQEIEVENIDTAYTNFALKVLSSLNGKTIAKTTTPFLAESEENYKRYLCDIDAKNHSLVFTGTFCLSCLSMKFHITSRR